MRCGINKRRLALIQKHFGIVMRESTWRRWRAWWFDEFVITKFWQQEKGRLAPTAEITQGPFPRVIFNFFLGNIEQKMLLFLRFLSPITIGIIHAISRENNLRRVCSFNQKITSSSLDAQN